MNGDHLTAQKNRGWKSEWLAESEEVFYADSDPSVSRVFVRDSNGRVSKLIPVDAQGNTVWTRMREGQ